MNPFPKGIRSGSATDKVNQALVNAFPKWLEHNEIMRLTGCSRGAVAWAIAYLDANQLVRSTKSARHPQYLRYQSMPMRTGADPD